MECFFVGPLSFWDFQSQALTDFHNSLIFGSFFCDKKDLKEMRNPDIRFIAQGWMKWAF